MSQCQPGLKDCEVTNGVWVHVGHHRKAVMGCIDCLWEVSLGDSCREDQALGLATELLPLCTLLPLVEIDLSQEVGRVVAASDASESGGGVTCSTGASDRGRLKLEEVRCLGRNAAADGLLLIEHCSGIGAVRWALEVLGVRPGGP